MLGRAEGFGKSLFVFVTFCNGRLYPRLFTVPYFSVKSQRSIIEFERSPSWFLYASETWGEYKMPVGRGAGWGR